VRAVDKKRVYVYFSDVHRKWKLLSLSLSVEEEVLDEKHLNEIKGTGVFPPQNDQLCCLKHFSSRVNYDTLKLERGGGGFYRRANTRNTLNNYTKR
jgi:hypothetical protein